MGRKVDNMPTKVWMAAVKINQIFGFKILFTSI